MTVGITFPTKLGRLEESVALMGYGAILEILAIEFFKFNWASTFGRYLHL